MAENKSMKSAIEWISRTWLRFSMWIKRKFTSAV